MTPVGGGLPPPTLEGILLFQREARRNLVPSKHKKFQLDQRGKGSVSTALIGAQLTGKALPLGELAFLTRGGCRVESSITPAGPRARAGSDQGGLPGEVELTQVSKAK